MPVYKKFKVFAKIVRLLRVFRVVRIFRIIGKLRGLQALVSTLLSSLPSIFSLLILMLILLFVYSILGVFFFRDIVKGQIINIGDGGYVGFRDFGVALMTCFKMTTNEDWNNIMADTQDLENCIDHRDCVSRFSYVYFMSFRLIQGYLVLNLFIFIAMDQFEKYYIPKDDIITKFRGDLDHFKKVWSFICQDGRFETISELRVPLLMNTLRAPLGIAASKMDRELLKMRIRVDHEGHISFSEMLYRVMKRLYGSQVLHTAPDMQLFEIVTGNLIKDRSAKTANN